jgi:hypothetical protein
MSPQLPNHVAPTGFCRNQIELQSVDIWTLEGAVVVEGLGRVSPLQLQSLRAGLTCAGCSARDSNEWLRRSL